MEKLRWLISDIFTELRKLNLKLGIKFENINNLIIREEVLEIYFFSKLFSEEEKKEINRLLIDHLKVKKIIFIPETKRIYYPYPVLNSKFNNFITFILINENKSFIEIAFFQKNNNNFYEKKKYYYHNIDDILLKIKDFVKLKIDLLKELYRYNQIILPFCFNEKELKFLITDWENFLKKEKIEKFVSTLFFLKLYNIYDN